MWQVGIPNCRIAESPTGLKGNPEHHFQDGRGSETANVPFVFLPVPSLTAAQWEEETGRLVPPPQARSFTTWPELPVGL
jgi:hypothetical protein